MSEDVPFRGANAHSRQMKSPAMDLDRWNAVRTIFNLLLDGADAQVLAGGWAAEVWREAAALYAQHVAAEEAGFLEEAITVVRNLTAPGRAETETFSPGQVLTDRFVIVRLLGRGGMGEVYLAEYKKLNERVALKTIRPELACEEEFRARFLTEIQSARQVTHPNVCRIFDLFEEGDVTFFSMEFLDGIPLDEYLKTVPVNEKQRRSIALQLAEGLHAAHCKQILHRDFKPQNVILVPDGSGAVGRAMITDFGLARTFSGLDRPNYQSLQAGTPAYMAPELATGSPASVRSDIFSFGRVLDQLIPSLRHNCCAPDPADRPESLETAIDLLRGERTTRRNLLIGLGGAAIAGALLYRALPHGPRFPLPSRQRVVLNGIRATSPAVAYTLGQLVRAGLSQSPLLSILPDQRLVAVLRTLKLPTELPAQLSDIMAAAQREKASLVLEGVAEPAAAGLKLILRVLQVGQTQPSLEVTQAAGDARQLVELADAATRQIRTEFGESELALKSAYVRLDQLTSASPEAVDLYFQATREYERTDTQAALALLDEAVAIDPLFAMAHHYRAICLWASTRTEAAIAATTKAFELRSRVTEMERNWIEFFYYNVCGDFLRSLTSIRKNVVLFPDDAMFQRNTASTYWQLRQFDAVIAYNERAVTLDPFSENARSEHIVNLASIGQPDKALSVFQRYRNEGVTTTLLEWGAGLAWMGKGEYRKADECYVRLGSTARRQRWSLLLRAGPAILEGRFAEAALGLEAGLAYDAMTDEGLRRYQRLQTLGSVYQLMDEPQKALAQARALCSLPAFGPSLRYLRAGVGIAAELSDFETAEEGLGRLREIEKKWPSTHSQGGLAHAEGLVAAARGETRADQLLTSALGLWPDPPTLYSIARWQGKAGDWQAQARTLDEWSRLRGVMHHDDYHALLVLGWLEQARCFTHLSHFADASRLYRQVLAHWGVNARDYQLVRTIQKEFADLRR